MSAGVITAHTENKSNGSHVKWYKRYTNSRLVFSFNIIKYKGLWTLLYEVYVIIRLIDNSLTRHSTVYDVV